MRRWLAAALLCVPLTAQAAQGCGIAGLLAVLDPVTRSLVNVLLRLDCTASAQSVVFGTVNPVGGTVDVNGAVQVNCAFSLLGGAVALPPILVCYDIALSAGQGTMTTRRLRSGTTNTMNYHLYTSPAYAVVWGDGTSGSAVVSDSFLLPLGVSNRTYPAYGRLPAGQAPRAGAYLDTITVTVAY